MLDLFKPYRIGELEIRNRFMRSATTSAYSDEMGVIKPEIIKIYANLAKGGIGLIIKGHLFITDSGKAHNGMAGISHEYHVPKLRELTDAVHANNGIIFAQLNHGGINASLGERKGPSEYITNNISARKMSVPEIWEVIEEFGNAAQRCMDANFDGIQIHAAHGYLLSSFLSSLVNQREDEWNGDLRSRMKIIEEVYDEVRGKIGYQIPLSIKLNCDDFSPTGFTIDDACKVSEFIALRGIDLIEISGGGIGSIADLRTRSKHHDPEYKELPFAGHCEKIRTVTKPKTLALVNGFKSLKTMQKVIDYGLCDIISLSRPLIKEPDLIERLKNGQKEARCIRCDACRSLFGKEILRCLIDAPT
ncbi:NADH:flavin oxidoreductase [Candidatus Bathyarchaeota archaeon]|nr:NADH:flavin oxidoreductase [Candidatus Bathyarchaeota archaeon]